MTTIFYETLLSANGILSGTQSWDELSHSAIGGLVVLEFDTFPAPLA